jgi:hypothetical protein
MSQIPYVFQPYPSWRYHWTKQARIVNNADEDAALGGGWGKPEEFAPYRCPRPGRSDQHDPLKWVDDWPVTGLSTDFRKKIKAQLLRADATFWQSSDVESAHLTAMKLAVGGIANILFEAGILSPQLLQTDIQILVWDAAVAGGWYRFASQTPANIFPDRIGHYYVWRDETTDWNGLFRAATAEWLGKLLDAPAQARAGDLTELQRELQAERDRETLQRKLERECRNGTLKYPKELYHSNGSRRVTFGLEEHVALRMEGWNDQASTAAATPILPMARIGNAAERAITGDAGSPQIAVNDSDSRVLPRQRQAVGNDSSIKSGTEVTKTPALPAEQTPPLAAYPARAAWFENELALRDWSVHDLHGQGGPDWKTSRKILDGLQVSRAVLEKTAAALSKKRNRVRLKDIPRE